MKKTLLILLMTSLLTGCQNKPYQMQPYNPLCLKLKYFTLTPNESLFIMTNGNRDQLENMELTRIAIKQECGGE